jgi:hypothetical protein
MTIIVQHMYHLFTDSFIENIHYYNVSAGLSTNPADDPLVVPPRGCEAASNFEGNFVSNEPLILCQ